MMTRATTTKRLVRLALVSAGVAALLVGCGLSQSEDLPPGCAPGQPGTAETCNGKDDNCNGDVDEGCDCKNDDVRECGKTLGHCKAGTQTCKNGTWSNCDDVKPESEVCDGEDNDCDGDVDESCPCTNGDDRECGKTLGHCEAGIQTCKDRKWSNCDDVKPEAEVCDGEDNDCDGDVDEHCPCPFGAVQSCGTDLGTCTVGQQTCEKDGWGACSGVAQSDEVCDGLDNNCDGVPDENCDCEDTEKRWCRAGVGACQSGEQTCEDRTWGPCLPEEDPVAEICNRIDDDCDGEVDNGFDLDKPCDSAGRCPQVRVCADDGQLSRCVDDVDHFSEEMCDGIDNDCDGLVDKVSDDGSLRSVCACQTTTLSIGDATDVSIEGGVNLCAATTCGPDRPLKLSIDGTCYPVCLSGSSDPDLDGWGWENGASCIVKTSPRALSAKPCGSDGPPVGMAMSYCLDCTGDSDLGYAMCQSSVELDLTRFVRGEVWLQVDYTFNAAGPTDTPINLWFTTGGLRKRLPLMKMKDEPGRSTVQLRAQDACFTPSAEYGQNCPGSGSTCDWCGTGEVCGALVDCGDYDLTHARLQIAAEYCQPESGKLTGTVTVNKVEFVEPNCAD